VESQNSTPVKIPKHFGLSSQSRSATPLLDAAIKNVGRGFDTDSPGNGNRSIDFNSPRISGISSLLIPGSPMASIPRSASKFPTMSPAILPVKQESSPTLARNALGSPLVQAGLERLVKSTPKSASSLRFTQIMMDTDDSIAMSMSPSRSTSGYKTDSTAGTPQASTIAGSPMDSPGLVESPVVAKSGRDSMAPFFENMRESLPNSNAITSQRAGRDSMAPFFENMRESLPNSNPITSQRAGRDSMAPIFENMRESLPNSNFNKRDSLPAAFANAAPLKRTGRDSVAGFFDNMRDSNMYNPRESIASSKRDSILSQPAIHTKGRDSIAGFFNNTRNSLMPAYGNSILASPATVAADESFASESSMQIDQESMILDQDDRVASEIAESQSLAEIAESQGLAEISMDNTVELESQDVDMSFDQDSVNFAPTADSSFDSNQSGISMDLTDTAKANPFWDSRAPESEADESVVLDAPSQSTMKELNFDTPKGSSTAPILPEVAEDSPKETFMSTPRGHKTQDESLDLVDVSPVRSTRLRSSTKKAVTQSAYTDVSTKKLKLETTSAPVSPTPAPVKKQKTPVKAKPKTPKKSSGVTPMRRAVAAKALANANNMDPVVTRSRRSSVASIRSPAAALASPTAPVSARKAEGSRKSLGGNLLQSLKNSMEENTEAAAVAAENDIDIANGEQVESIEPERPESDHVSVMSVVGSEEQQVDSQSQFQNSVDDDLMDERHLSIMDDSILQEQVSMESNRPSILDYKDFVESTGISFEDHYTPVISVPEETVGSVFEATIAELERENFTQGSAELEKIIIDLGTEIGTLKSAMDDSVPLLFDEYSQGSSRERQDILSQLRLLKSVCFERAKVEWFSWKELTLDYLYNGLQEYFEELKNQHNSILPMLQDFKVLGKEAREYYDTLSRDVPVARDE
jgi:Spc7 kinetochore protein